MVTAGHMPATVRGNVSGRFSRTVAASPHQAGMLRPRAGAAWPPPDRFQKGAPWTRPAGPRRLASSSRWVSRGVPASSRRPSRAGPGQHVWPPARPVCRSARATPLGPPRPSPRLRHPPAALARRDDRAPRQGPPAIARRGWHPPRSWRCRLCAGPGGRGPVAARCTRVAPPSWGGPSAGAPSHAWWSGGLTPARRLTRPWRSRPDPSRVPAAMRLGTAPGSGVGATARHLGRNAQWLRRWQRAAATTPPAACPGNGRGSPAQDA